MKYIKLSGNNIFIENYIYYLWKIIEFHEEFLENFQNYPTVFKNWNIKKVDKDEKFFEGIKSDLEKFVAKNQLETIFQKSFLLNIMNEEKEKIDVFIDETHWTELLNIVLEKDKEYNWKKFDILLQLQWETIKFVFASQDYNNSNKGDLWNMLDVFEKISTNNLVNNWFNKINKPKSKGYISLSKKFLEIPYWKKEKKDIIYKIKDEIDKSKKIVEIIMEYIKKDHKKSKE